VTTLTELREVLGDERLERFLAFFAASNVAIPKAPRGAFFAELVRAVGSDGAALLREHFGGDRFYVPSSMKREQRNAEIEARYDSGESVHSISRSYRDLSRRQIERITMKARAK
jgi:hypothetical protein